jgi:hypothetical protein
LEAFGRRPPSTRRRPSSGRHPKPYPEADPADGCRSSIQWLRFWELPFSGKNFIARTIEPDHVIPVLHDRQTIRDLSVTTAETDRYRAVLVFDSRDVVKRVGIVQILLVVAFGVIKVYRPKSIDGDVVDLEYIMKETAITAAALS